MFACAQWGAVGEFAASRHGAFTRKQAAELGLSKNVIRRLVAAGHLREPAAGVLVVSGSVDSWQQRLAVATLGSRGATVAGYRSAAALHGLDGYPPGPVEVLAPSARPTIARIATVHRGPMDPRDLTVINSLACTGLARTLVDICSVDPVERAQLAFESAWRRGTSLRWLRATTERLHRPGQRGTKVMLRLLEQAECAGRSTESALETRVGHCLQGLPGLVRQYQVADHVGSFVARVDFAVPAARLAIEAHSRQFHFAPGAVSADEAREHALRAAGWDVLYIGAKSLESPAKLQQQVLAAIGRRSAP